jgi:protocatechuate 4,5-dioxygenase, alpha chain
MADRNVSAIIEYDKAAARSLLGTYLFDGLRAQKNYALNKMCMSLTKPENRREFAADEARYCQKFGLDEEIIRLVTTRNWLEMVRSGGNIYYVYKLAAIDHISMQQVGAQQNSMTLEQFREKLNSHKELDHG